MNCKHCGCVTTRGAYCLKQECNRVRCKEYYETNKEEQRKRKLEDYFNKRKDPKKLEQIRTTNRRANEKRRFGTGTRNIIIKRDSGRCRFCKNKTNLIHHLDVVGRNTENPNNDIKNLVLCCKSCHAKIHLLNRKLVLLECITL